jgi:hypothetical protein
MLGEIYNWFTEGFDTADPEGRQSAARRAVGINRDALREVQLRKSSRCTLLHEVRRKTRAPLPFLQYPKP